MRKSRNQKRREIWIHVVVILLQLYWHSFIYFFFEIIYLQEINFRLQSRIYMPVVEMSELWCDLLKDVEKVQTFIIRSSDREKLQVLGYMERLTKIGLNLSWVICNFPSKKSKNLWFMSIENSFSRMYD